MEINKKILFFIFATVLLTVFFLIAQNKHKTVIQIGSEISQDETEKIIEKTPHPDTIPAMMQKEFRGDDLKLENVLEENEVYTRYHITYKSEGFKISGIMNVPQGKGPFPILILNHGYIDQKVYTNGQGLKREQDFFARSGYVVLHSDYRNHAQSDFDSKNEVRPRSGYVEDVLNAVSAVKKSLS